MNKKIVLTGGKGLLGQELIAINPKIIAPSRSELDVTNIDNILHEIEWFRPNIIIHCAALTDDRTVEKDPAHTIETNIIGTANLAIICIKLGIRLVYLSTDYVYKGNKGGYKEDDELLPSNLYSWTKLGGECALKGVKNHLIIRTSFGASKFPYKEAFSDRWRSKDYVDVIAPMIYEASLSDLQGIVNIGTGRKSMFSYAKERNPEVKPVLLKDTNFSAPWDTSFNLDKWNNFKNQ